MTVNLIKNSVFCREPGRTWIWALTFFITAKEGERCTPRTIETYRWSLERFIT